MRKLLPILAGLALVATAAQAGTTKIVKCDDEKEDCPKIYRVTTSGEDPRLVLLNGDDQDPTYLSLSQFMSQRGYLGVSLTDLTPELREHFGVDRDSGVMVSRVEKDSPAADAGVQVGDIITLVDGKDVSGSHQIALAVRSKEDNDPIDLEVWRDGRAMTLTAVATQKDRVRIDLSGLSALGNMKAFGVDGDAINKSVEDALKNLKYAVGEDGSYRFQFDPETAKKFREQWNLKFDGTTFPEKVESMQAVEEQMAERMRQLEERLKELEEQLDKEDR